MANKAGEEFHSGFVALLGRPNVGKSSLVNALAGQKITIVSPKPQTTRRRVQAVLTTPRQQVVFLDTPGVQVPRDRLGQSMARAAADSLAGVDAALLVVDAVRRRGEEDRAAAAMLAGVPARKMLVVNKIDLAPEDPAGLTAQIAGAIRFEGPAMAISALTGEGVSALRDWIFSLLPPGPQYFPPGTLSDQPEEVLIAELIREQVLLQIEAEIPYQTAVKVEEIAARPGRKLYLRAAIIVDRPSQKGIIIGAGGSRLQAIGRAARESLESHLGEPVYLDLWVQVERNWRDSSSRLKEYGYEE